VKDKSGTRGKADLVINVMQTALPAMQKVSTASKVILQKTHLALAFYRLQVNSIRAKNHSQSSNKTHLVSQYHATPRDTCFVYGRASESLKDSCLASICPAHNEDPEFQFSVLPERHVNVVRDLVAGE